MSEPKPNKSDRPSKGLFDSAFYFLLVIVLATGGLAIWLKGTLALSVAANMMIADAVIIAPLVVVGVIVGAFFTVLVPREVVSRLLGTQAGMKGIFLATFLGAIMPGGPFASFPVVFALGRSGAGVGAMVSFLIAWAAIGVSRLITWEIPFMGIEFGALRFVSSLPLPIIAGLIANWLIAKFPHLDVTQD